MKLNHLLIPYIALLAFLFGGMVISTGVPWYETLVLPAWHPTAPVIAFVWALIYLCAAWSFLIIWNTTKHDHELKLIIGTFTVLLLVNLGWAIVFFFLHSFLGSVWFALLLGFSVLVLIALILRRSEKAAFLLAPYALWVFFAAYLNYVVMMLN